MSYCFPRLYIFDCWLRQFPGFAHLMEIERIPQIHRILDGQFDELDELDNLVYHMKNELRVALRLLKSLEREVRHL